MSIDPVGRCVCKLCLCVGAISRFSTTSRNPVPWGGGNALGTNVDRGEGVRLSVCVCADCVKLEPPKHRH